MAIDVLKPVDGQSQNSVERSETEVVQPRHERLRHLWVYGLTSGKRECIAPRI